MKIGTAVLIAAAIAFVVGPRVMSASEVESVSGACTCNGTSGPANCPYVYYQRDCSGSYYSCNFNENGRGDCWYYTPSSCESDEDPGGTGKCPGHSNAACSPK